MKNVFYYKNFPNVFQNIYFATISSYHNDLLAFHFKIKKNQKVGHQNIYLVKLLS